MRQYLLTLFFFGMISGIVAEERINVLVITGGKKLDSTEFYNIFSHKDILMKTMGQPEANKLLVKETETDYDVLIFYDITKEISEETKKIYLNLLHKGTGMIFLHHSLVSYQNWRKFENIIGGKYKNPKYKNDTTDLSDFKHDVLLKINCDQTHPICKGLSSFEILDEGYLNINVNRDVKPILTTESNYCDPIIGWSHHVNNSKVVYLMPGHNKNAFNNEVYKKIIQNAIFWVKKKK